MLDLHVQNVPRQQLDALPPLPLQEKMKWNTNEALKDAIMKPVVQRLILQEIYVIHPQLVYVEPILAMLDYLQPNHLTVRYVPKLHSLSQKPVCFESALNAIKVRSK